MSRNRRSAKTAGSRFERTVADYLAAALDDDRIDRRVKTGNKDRGDIGGLRIHGQRLVVETKDYGGKYLVSEWLREAEVERGNDDALAAVVIAKRRGVSAAADQVVFMTLGDFAALITGDGPDAQV